MGVKTGHRKHKHKETYLRTKSLKMKLQVILILIVGCFQAQSLRCYECERQGFCSTSSDMGKDRMCTNGDKTVCIKIQEEGGEKSVKRFCGNHDSNMGRNTCKKTKVDLHSDRTVVPVTFCTCNTDYCNNARRANSGMLLLIPSVISLILCLQNQDLVLS